MSDVPNSVSVKPWEPIWDVRTRPTWVQVTILDLLRQLRALRTLRATLPSIDTLGFPALRQLRVVFGDLDALCDAIEFIQKYNANLGAAYGGPDEKGTLWIKFYKMYSADEPWENPLQFIIWIDSVRPSAIALAASSHLVYEQTAHETERIDKGRRRSAAIPGFPCAWGETQSAWVVKNGGNSRRLPSMNVGRLHV